MNRFSDEDVIRLLRQIEVEQHLERVANACRSAGVSLLVICYAIDCQAVDATYYGWRKKFGGMGPSKVKRMKELEKENQCLRRAGSDLTLDKLILKESLDYLKPKA